MIEGVEIGSVIVDGTETKFFAPECSDNVHLIADITTTEETNDIQQALTEQDCEYLNNAKKISAVLHIPIKNSGISPTGTLKFGLYQTNWYGYSFPFYNGNFTVQDGGNHIIAVNYDRVGEYYGFTGIRSYAVTGITLNVSAVSNISDGLMVGNYDYTKMSIRAQSGSINFPVGTRIMFYITT